jgi:transcriptional regulator with XRE-family HTH domain
MPQGSDFPNGKSIADVRIFGNAAAFGFSYDRRVDQSPEFDWHLAEWMAALKVSQAELCRRTGWPKTKMSELVNGVSRYNRDVVNPLAKALDIEPHELLMQPQDAYALRRLRESAFTIAAQNAHKAGVPEGSSEKPKKIT